MLKLNLLLLRLKHCQTLWRLSYRHLTPFSGSWSAILIYRDLCAFDGQ